MVTLPGFDSTVSSGGPSRHVLLIDDEAPRADVVAQAVAQCDAAVVGTSEIHARAASLYCHTAMIALAGPPAGGDQRLEAVQTLKHKGYTVISYGDGAQRWPLGTRCRALLAGSAALLDSATPDFSQELGGLLEQLFEAESRRHHERLRVKDLMPGLGVVGDSEALIGLFRSVLKFSSLSDLPTLITGETGTGKQLIAQALHTLDAKRCTRPFVAVNCGAISPALAESEFFGHRRGAFTGAHQERKGLVRSAHGGTLFLDEIGELDEALQAKLLRVLQESRVLGVGEDREVVVSVRVIAATNRDLDLMLAQGTFRSDLFHRLNVLSLHVPPLRERPEDVKPLVEHFLRKHQALHPAATLAIHPEFIEALTRANLPGNVRQLDSIIKRALLNKEDDTPLSLGDLPPEVWHQLSCDTLGTADQPLCSVETAAAVLAPVHLSSDAELPGFLEKLARDNGWNLSQSMRQCERLLLEVALRLASGNQSQTARLLGITPRSVYSKVRKHHIHR